MGASRRYRRRCTNSRHPLPLQVGGPDPIYFPPACPADRDPKDWAGELDRSWFAGNPGQRSYFRLYVPGETAPVEPPDPAPGWRWAMQVTQLGPGVRTRGLTMVALVGETAA
jgi:hypothetical protein